MNFLNDSLKTLKTVLAEGLDQSVYEGDTSEAGGADARGVGQAENENLKKLCQHQSDEVIFTLFMLLRCCLLRVVHCT